MSTPGADQRPMAVSLTLYILAFAGVFNIIYSFTGVYAPYGLLYPAANMLITVGIFASFAGIGSMEKWGLYLFLVMILLKLVLDLVTGAFTFWDLLLLIPLGVFSVYFSKMK